MSLQFVDQFIAFVRENLPAREGTPYLVHTPSAPTQTRCVWISKTYGDTIHHCITLPEEQQQKLTSFFNETRLDKLARAELYEAYLDADESAHPDYTLQQFRNVRREKTLTPFLLLTVLRGTHQYSFYL